MFDKCEQLFPIYTRIRVGDMSIEITVEICQMVLLFIASLYRTVGTWQ